MKRDLYRSEHYWCSKMSFLTKNYLVISIRLVVMIYSVKRERRERLSRSNAQLALKILIKILDTVKHVELNIQNNEAQKSMILSSSIYYHPYLQSSLKEFSKLFKCLAFSYIYMIPRQLDLLFNALHQETNRRKEGVFTRVVWAP